MLKLYLPTFHKTLLTIHRELETQCVNNNLCKTRQDVAGVLRYFCARELHSQVISYFQNLLISCRYHNPGFSIIIYLFKITHIGFTSMPISQLNINKLFCNFSILLKSVILGSYKTRNILLVKTISQIDTFKFSFTKYSICEPRLSFSQIYVQTIQSG